MSDQFHKAAQQELNQLTRDLYAKNARIAELEGMVRAYASERGEQLGGRDARIEELEAENESLRLLENSGEYWMIACGKLTADEPLYSCVMCGQNGDTKGQISEGETLLQAVRAALNPENQS